ncbi:MAG: hypothetical protein KC776_28085 [Myxococcales bacterium]|nr:hypothetical protein [Myxococcales bacterium]MCB9577941.1 hypothetical protein [Polyangiaceae bacterium]
MTRTSSPPNAATSIPPDPNVTGASIARLREELEGNDSPTAQAVLLHEIAVLEELASDESGAARDYLASINAEPEFSEPLERLIAILQRRSSQKNLGKLLERLVAVADGAEERARALAERAAFVIGEEQDIDTARALLEEAVDEKPDDGGAWLALEVVAGTLSDESLRAKCLAARARLCQHPTWQALLLLDLGRLQLELGDDEAAIGSIQAALEQKSEATYVCLASLEEVARRLGKNDVAAQALEARATLITRAMEDESTGDALGVPRSARSKAHAAEALLRASDAHRRRGDIVAASASLARATELLPTEPAFGRAQIALAQAQGNTEATATLARGALEQGSKGAMAAALWLRVAEWAAEQGDGPGALDAVNKALVEDAGSIPARALALDLLSGGHDPQALASTLEATAEQLESDEGKARFFLAASDAWARRAGDVAGAKAALSQAGMYGTEPGTLARVSRMLSALIGDAAWFEDSTRRLLAAGATESEQASLWFELARSRLGRKELPSGTQALASLAESAGGAWLGNVLRSFALPLLDGASSEEGRTALGELAKLETDPFAGRALRLLRALRALGADDRQSAVEELSALHEEDASDLVVAAALASLARLAGEEAKAAEVLSACALATADTELAAALQLEAGIAFWQSGDRSRAVESFNAASANAPAAGSALLSWALRAAEPNSIDARRRALEAAAEDADPAALALERFALEAGKDGNPNEAADALEQLKDANDEIGRAALLAQALWTPEDADPTAAEQALDAIAELGGTAAAIARASEHVLGLSATPAGTAPEPMSTSESARRWTEADASPPAALEWLASTIALEDRDAEVEARRAVATRIPTADSALACSAAIVSRLAGDESTPLLPTTDELSRLTNLELAPPGADPRRRAHALAAAQSSLGEESSSLVRALYGYNCLASGDIEAATSAFRAVVEAYPDELIGWEGLRAAAEEAKDRATVAEASAALGDAISDDHLGAELWEHAALILIDELDDVQRGEFALSRAVERDVGRFVAFDKLFRIVRARKDGKRLLELIAKRLDVAEDPEEIAKLFWERARVLRGAGDRDGALAALENVTMLEPDHVGALALSGEIYLTSGKLGAAAEKLGRLSTLEEAPAKQRLMSGVAAVDIFENKLNDPEKALTVLESLYKSGLSTLPVRERLARSAAKLGAWEQATQVLEQLMNERESSSGRTEAARLAVAIHRDRQGHPERALSAVERLLEESPDDGEALDLVLSGVFPPDVSNALLSRGRDTIVGKLVQEPMDPERVDRLARIAARLDLPRVRQAALGALVTLGEGSPEIDRELAVLDQRVARVPQMAIDETALPELCDPEDRGPVPSLMRALATTFAEALGPGLEAFGVGRKQRVDPRAGLPVRNEIAAWAGALGVGDFDLYVGGKDPMLIAGVASETPAVVIGAEVNAPLSAAHRQAVARELFALRRGVTILRHRDPTDVAALVVAACRVVGIDVPSPQYAMLGEFQRVLTKEMPRRVKKVLPELATAVAHSGQDPLAWVRAATSSLDRLAAIAAGDVSYVLSGGDIPRGRLGASMEAQARAARLLGFVLSPTYLSLREKLGMGVR